MYKVDEIVKVKQSNGVTKARVIGFSEFNHRWILCPAEVLSDWQARHDGVTFYADAADIFPTGETAPVELQDDLVSLR